MRVRLLSAALLPLLAWACTAAPSSIDAGVAVAELPCSTDAECAEQKLVCDRLRRTCVCTGDAMCEGNPGGPYCNAFTGRCVREVAGCKSDAECPDGQYCDAGLRTCRARKAWCEGCSQDVECGPGNFCVRHPDYASAPAFCGEGCPDAGCGAGRKCADTAKGRQCVPDGARCGQVVACTPDSGKPCADDAACGDASQVCDQGQARCVARQAGCVAGQSCDPATRQCVAACANDRECVDRYSDPLYACRGGTCVRGETCKADADCAAQKWCLKPPGAGPDDLGACQPACASDDECPLGQRCPSEVSAHRRCTPGCAANDGCPLTAICNGGACESANVAGVRRCQATQVCAAKERCVTGTGDPSTDHTCQPMSPPICRACGAGCGSDYCATVIFATGERITRCVSYCRDDDQCPSGFYCIPVGAPGGTTCMPVDPATCR